MQDTIVNEKAKFHYCNDSVNVVFYTDNYKALKLACQGIDTEISIDPSISVENDILKYHIFTQGNYNVIISIPMSECNKAFYHAYKELKVIQSCQ